MQRTTPPFRADHVGSLLRPERVKEARAKLAEGQMSADELRRIEDQEIEKVVRKQKAIGLQLATDGEFRRSWWHYDFLAKLIGCELYHPEGLQFAGVTTRADSVRVIGKVDFPADHPMLDHYRFLHGQCVANGTVAKRQFRRHPCCIFAGAGAEYPARFIQISRRSSKMSRRPTARQ